VYNNNRFFVIHLKTQKVFCNLFWYAVHGVKFGKKFFEIFKDLIAVWWKITRKFHGLIAFLSVSTWMYWKTNDIKNTEKEKESPHGIRKHNPYYYKSDGLLSRQWNLLVKDCTPLTSWAMMEIYNFPVLWNIPKIYKYKSTFTAQCIKLEYCNIYFRLFANKLKLDLHTNMSCYLNFSCEVCQIEFEHVQISLNPVSVAIKRSLLLNMWCIRSVEFLFKHICFTSIVKQVPPLITLDDCFLGYQPVLAPNVDWRNCRRISSLVGFEPADRRSTPRPLIFRMFFV
jgi:hypothetical protein